MKEIRPLVVREPPLPGNNQHFLLLDTTQLSLGADAAASAHVPGSIRNRLAGKRMAGFYKPTNQDVTVYFEVLTNPTGTTSAAFEIDPSAPDAGTKVVAAGTAYQFSWLPAINDFRIRGVAGATAPTAHSARIEVLYPRMAGIF